MYKCKNCEKEFEDDYRSKKTQGASATKIPSFCCRSCYRQFNGKIIIYKDGYCKECNEPIKIRKGTKKELCGKCSNLYKVRKTKQRKFIIGDGKYKNKATENVCLRNKEKKEELVKYKGGKCYFCGYSKHLGALEFHHINPGEKEFAVNLSNLGKSWERCFAEANKCVLICANCHRELHAGLIKYEVEMEVLST
jgi:5-methylcytosine-specific restriction endonuclease McrA